MAIWDDLFGTTRTTFGIGLGAARAVLSAVGLTGVRTHSLPDASGTMALKENYEALGIGVVSSTAAVIADMDDATVLSGIYTAGAGITGNPIGAAGVVVHRVNGAAGFQLFSANATNRLLWRRRSSSAWAAWKEVAALDANNVAFTGGSITGITDLAVADGGTGASTAVGARTNLGIDDLGLGINVSNVIPDFDDATMLSGLYTTTVAGTTLGTIPAAGAAGVLLHRAQATTAAQAVQLFISTTTSRMFWRRRSSSAWAAWQEVADVASFAALAGAAFTGAVSFASTVVAAAIGPTVARQHTLPNVASSEVLIAATTQTIGGRKVFSLLPIEVVTQTSKAAAGTMLASDLLGGSILYTGAAGTLTLPTGTLMESELNTALGAAAPVGATFSVVITNTGAGTLTIGAGVGFTLQGVGTITTTEGQRWLARKTALNTFVFQRG